MKTTRRAFPELVTPAEVGAALGVDPHTVLRWANTGKLRAVLTPAGRRRYFRAEIDALVRGEAW